MVGACRGASSLGYFSCANMLILCIRWKKEGSGPQFGLSINEVADLADVWHYLLGTISRCDVQDRVIDPLHLHLLD